MEVSVLKEALKMPLKQAGVLLIYNALLKEDVSGHSISDARKISKGNAAKANFVFDKKIKVKKVFDHVIEGRHGNIPIRIYKPNNKENLPVVIYFHGGGFVVLDIETHDNVCRRISKVANAVVVSVNYRLAPENKFPVPLEDCYDACVWGYNNTEYLGGDKTKIFVCGDSAGGNLANGVSMLLTGQNKIRLAGQILIYPCTDARMCHPSLDYNNKYFFLRKERLRWYRDNYIRDERDILNPLVSPLLSENLNDMPPTFLLTAGLDPLLDEGKLYVDRLNKSGVKIEYKNYQGLIHGFINIPLIGKEAMKAYYDIANFIKETLSY